MEESLVKQDQTTTLLHRIINTDYEYDLKQQTQINDKLDNFVNGIKRDQKWKTVLELPGVTTMLSNILSYPESLRK